MSQSKIKHVPYGTLCLQLIEYLVKPINTLMPFAPLQLVKLMLRKYVLDALTLLSVQGGNKVHSSIAGNNLASTATVSEY